MNPILWMLTGIVLHWIYLYVGFRLSRWAMHRFSGNFNPAGPILLLYHTLLWPIAIPLTLLDQWRYRKERK